MKTSIASFIFLSMVFSISAFGADREVVLLHSPKNVSYPRKLARYTVFKFVDLTNSLGF